MSQPMSKEAIAAFRADFQRDGARRIAMHAVVKNGLTSAADERAVADNPMSFSIEIKTGKITNQKSSGRCWLFAGLNVIRWHVMQTCNLETFELSQSYQMFWDKFEKANFFLEAILETLCEDTDSRVIDHLLADPIQDGGQWDMFCALVDKYGVVPKTAMPESHHSSSSSRMNGLITCRLREDACILRTAHRAGAAAEELCAKKQDMMREVYAMLCVCLGEPPEKFTWEYRDKDEGFHREADIDPRAFVGKFAGIDLADYVSVINAPTEDKPYYKSYTVQYLGNVVGGRAVKYLNLPVEEQKALAIRQLSDGEPVWFGCDVGQRLERDAGLMALNSFAYSELLGVPFGMDKAMRLDYNESVLTHAMVFLGVNLVDGKPNRWKVENSWGKDSGQEGHYIMTDEWFDEFNYQVVVNKKYLVPEQLAAYERDPVVLAPWDPMGSLA